MTSIERHEARYQRRKAKRLEKQKQFNTSYENFNDLFSLDNLIDSFYQCKKGISWKASTQKYEKDLLKNVYNTQKIIYNNESISKGFYTFKIKERGKERLIKSVHISERVVQKNLNVNCLLPILKRSLIYDNGASLKNKGVDFTNKRLVKHINDFYKKYQREGYILLIDFSKYFDNIEHKPILDELENKISNKKIFDLFKQFIIAYGEKGLGLGSEINQTLAINYPNKIDHYIKEKLKIKGYGRYMDDSYLIHYDKEYLKMCLNKIIELCNEIGIKINKNKTQIVKLTHQFTFLKIRYNITENGKIIKKPCKQSITRMRRKLKKFKKFYNQGIMSLKDIECSYQSYRGYFKHKNGYKSLQNLDQLYHDLFIREKMKELIENMH